MVSIAQAKLIKATEEPCEKRKDGIHCRIQKHGETIALKSYSQIAPGQAKLDLLQQQQAD
jgi:hypothetical protein